MKLTKAQAHAVQIAEDDGELEIGGLDGRKVRRDVAERLVEMGVFVRTHTPIYPLYHWGYQIKQEQPTSHGAEVSGE